MNNAEDLHQPKPSPLRRWLRRIFFAILLLGLCFLLAPMGNAVPFLFVTHLAIGWWWHAANVLPPLLPQWPALLLPLACLAIAIPLAHRSIVWFASARNAVFVWRLPQTLGVMALFLLASAAAIAMSGITHQLAWLLRTQSIESTGSGGSFSKVWGTTKDLVSAILEFERTEGRYPESLAEVEEAFPALRGRSRVAPAAGRPLEPFIYIKPPSADAVGMNTVLIVSPARPTTDLVFVGFASGSVSPQRASEVPPLLGQKDGP
jgi:hypothetical protein